MAVTERLGFELAENMKVMSQAFGKPEIYRATHRRRVALFFSRSSNRFAEAKG
jgi:hypothetical protein